MGKKRPKGIASGRKKPKLSKVKKDNINTYKRLKQRRAALNEANEQKPTKGGKKTPDAPVANNKIKKRAQKIQALAQAAGVAPRKKPKISYIPERDEDDDYYDVIQSVGEEDEEEIVEEVADGDVAHETIDEEHLHFIESIGGGSDFLTGIEEDQKESARARKKKRKEKENALPDYERQPRKSKDGGERKMMKRMLPVKSSSGLEHRYAERTDQLEVEESVLSEEDKSQTKQMLPAVSTLHLFAQRRAKIAKKKQEIALLASAVVENPERNIGKLRELRELMEITEPDVIVTVRKLAMVSLNEVFIDIIPGYRIRELTEKEKEAQLSKEVKIKRNYEEALLKQYQLYLDFLEKTVNDLDAKNKPKKKKRKLTTPLSNEARLSVAVVAVESMCKLLLATSHFNYRVNLISVIVFLMKNKNKKIADTCIDCISRLFKEDNTGDVSAEAVRFIGRMVKGRNYKVKAKVLDTLLHLRIKEAIINEEASREEKKKELLKRKEKIKRMSRSQRRYNKTMERLDQELKLTEASVDKKRRMIVQTDVVQTVFAVYFRILKHASDSTLLPSVLEGLAKFAHLINVEFFDDLVKVLHELIASETLAPRESLHCVLTAFNILSGQGDALNIDPSRFYSLFYMNLLNVHAGKTCDNASLVLDCLVVMITRRHKHVTVQRVMAYLKRLGTVSLQTLPNACLGLLCAIRNIMKLYPKTDILLDCESVGSGSFLPEVEEPEHSHAQNTALWELHFLKKHYHPTVRQYSQHVSINAPSSGAGALNAAFSRRKPIELYKEFNPADMTFNPPILTKQEKNKQKRAPHHSGVSFLQKDFESYLHSMTELCHNPTAKDQNGQSVTNPDTSLPKTNPVSHSTSIHDPSGDGTGKPKKFKDFPAKGKEGDMPALHRNPVRAKGQNKRNRKIKKMIRAGTV